VLELGADIIVMVHPDYQYSPLLVPAMASMIAYGEYDLVLGSRILAQNSVARGMPRYKYVANRFLTLVENIFLRQKLSEYHTGLRAFSSTLLAALDRRGVLPDSVRDRLVVDQPEQECPIRPRRAAHLRAVSAPQARVPPLSLPRHGARRGPRPAGVGRCYRQPGT
jgi:hypothetical protein